ncbi:hypothetical protein PMAYCL1PPCAC_29730, partial [Pristionchus mayeri]
EVVSSTLHFEEERQKDLVAVSAFLPLVQSVEGGREASIDRLEETIMAFQRHGMHGDEDLPWPLHLLHILFGYSLVVIPSALFVLYVKQRANVVYEESSSLVGRAVRAFALGRPEYELLGGGKNADREDVTLSRRRCFREGILLLTMFMGIQVSFVTMGYLQEEVMTTAYQQIDDTEQFDRFGDGQFLIFCNRLVALVVCAIFLAANWKKQPTHVPPFYKHAYTSFSNTMSAWCQYEALKYVSFPTQTICKASKVAATMIMAVIVRRQRYSMSESLCGVGITLGASLFLLSSHSEGATKDEGEITTTISGMVLMLGYLSFDAFTVNWQKALFDPRLKVSRYQMMLGVNLFSAVLCAVSLWEQGSLSTSTSFALTHNGFGKDAFLLSLSGAVGQLFIYTTIEKFGPIAFAVMMTVRQMISIIVSTLSYNHSMTGWGILGFTIVFGSIFADIFRRYRTRK